MSFYTFLYLKKICARAIFRSSDHLPNGRNRSIHHLPNEKLGCMVGSGRGVYFQNPGPPAGPGTVAETQKSVLFNIIGAVIENYSSENLTLKMHFNYKNKGIRSLVRRAARRDLFLLILNAARVLNLKNLSFYLSFCSIKRLILNKHQIHLTNCSLILYSIPYIPPSSVYLSGSAGSWLGTVVPCSTFSIKISK